MGAFKKRYQADPDAVTSLVQGDLGDTGKSRRPTQKANPTASLSPSLGWSPSGGGVRAPLLAVVELDYEDKLDTGDPADRTIPPSPSLSPPNPRQTAPRSGTAATDRTVPAGQLPSFATTATATGSGGRSSADTSSAVTVTPQAAMALHAASPRPGTSSRRHGSPAAARVVPLEETVPLDSPHTVAVDGAGTAAAAGLYRSSPRPGAGHSDSGGASERGCSDHLSQAQTRTMTVVARVAGCSNSSDAGAAASSSVDALAVQVADLKALVSDLCTHTSAQVAALTADSRLLLEIVQAVVVNRRRLVQAMSTQSES